nr:uncharacterized protein LOC109158994 [Ipomoea batatas]
MHGNSELHHISFGNSVESFGDGVQWPKSKQSHWEELVYFDRVQFKGMRVNRTYPTIIGWSAELARKRVKEENKAGSFGRGTVLPRISKPTDVAAATSRQNDQPPIAAEPALNIPSSSVDRVEGILQKLASTVGEFGEAMTEIGKQGAPVNVMRKTFLGLSNMLNVASTIETTSTPTSSQLDDIFFGSESFTMVVDALIFFPVLRHGHCFLICVNVKASKLEIIDNKSLVRGVTMKDKYGDCTTLLVTTLKEYLALGSSALFWKVDELTEEVVDMSWKESENYIDCGLFVMRHMETYKWTLKKWNPGFRKKASLNYDRHMMVMTGSWVTTPTPTMGYVDGGAVVRRTNDAGWLGSGEGWALDGDEAEFLAVNGRLLWHCNDVRQRSRPGSRTVATSPLWKVDAVFLLSGTFPIKVVLQFSFIHHIFGWKLRGMRKLL